MIRLYSRKRVAFASLIDLRGLPWGEIMSTARLSVVRSSGVEVLSAEMGISERVVLMCASSLFTGLTKEQCREIASCARARNFARDELLFMQGQPMHSLMLIQAGSV